jgi:hypothetical protein
VGGQAYAPGAVVHTMTTDATGTATTSNNLLPYGNYEIVEKTPPTGYLGTGVIRQTFTIKDNGVIVSLKTADKVIKNDVIRGGIEIEKWDFELNRGATPQGDATLEGAVLEIWNRSPHSVLVGGVEYAPDTVVHTLTTNTEGWAGTPANLLPYGSYEIIEKTPPTGYLGTGVIKQSFQIRENGIVVSLKTDGKVIKNDVIRGGVEIEKWDIERNERTLKQGDATLDGAVLEIWNRSVHSVLVGGIEYAPDTVVHTLTTNADGWAGTEFDLLPYGSYEIIERTPPTGYLNTGVIRQAFQIRENGKIISLKTDDTAIKNDIIRGGVSVEKWDNEIDEHRAQGGATLENAVFELVNRSADSVLVLDVLYAPGDVVYTFATDDTGTAVTSATLLPYGTSEVRESTPPTGYLATGVLTRTFVIREHGVIVELHSSDTAIKNNPIRGDLRGVKISDGDAKRLANVPFSITSKTTGESHVIVTDVNGHFDTSSAWNPHSQNTNRGETDRDGVWFGEMRTLNDDLGALLFDTYIIEELRCEANKDYELLSFEISVYRHNTVIDLGTLTNDYTVQPEIFTTARDQATDTGEAVISESTTIIDTVYYSGLKAGQEYTVKGVLMLKETGEPLLVGGAPVTAEKTFRASGKTGSVSMEFTFDSTALAGKSVVVFESLEMDGAEIASHADIEDEGQTVVFHEPEIETKEPKIGTSAAGPSGEKELDIGSEVTLVDTVSYENLTVGKSYTLKGVLMDKATGEPLLVNGEKIASETTFTPDTPNGTAKVTFTFDSTALIGKTVVVFESLELDGAEVTAHADIDDKGQTVTFQAPKIGTTAKAEDGSKTIPIAESVVVVDTVAYDNLVPGQKYVLKGVLMDKETGQPLMKDGKPVTAETAFTPASPSGSAEVRFTFDSRAIAGRTLVVFESLEFDGKEIAAHADINDAAQAVSVDTPKPPTPTPPPPPVPGKAVPQTGDDYSAILWLALAAIALPGLLISIGFLCKKRRKALIPLILCAALLAVSAVMALNEIQQYNDGAEAYEKLEQLVIQPAPKNTVTATPGQTEAPSETKEEAGSPASSLPFVDFDGLRAVNPEIVGWLISDGTPINYPVAQGADNSRYCRDISVKTRSALNVKRDNGDYVGACPIYGYRKSGEDKNRLVVDEYPASVVRDIFRMKIDGMSALKIAETLNERGVLSPMAYKRDRGLPHPKKGFADRADAKWSATAIFRILNDETYTGALIQGRQGTLNYKIKNLVDKPQSEWKRTENAHEAIIEKQDFDLARRIMKLDTRTAPGGDKVYLFSGILICGCCGARMTRKTVPYKDRSYFYYYCPTGKKNGCAGASMIKEDDLIGCVLDSVKAHIAAVASLESILAGSDGQKAARALVGQLDAQIGENTNQLDQILRFKASLYENMVTGLLFKEDYKMLKAKYAADEALLRDAISALAAERENALSGKAEHLRWTEHFKRFENLGGLDRRAVVNLLQSIRVVSKTELEFTFNYQDEYEKALHLIGKEAA